MRTYLIQRLALPRKWSPFAFGGGFVDGGISEQGKAILQGIFSPEYMGAAEFEYGAFPQALAVLAAAPTLQVGYSDICAPIEKLGVKGMGVKRFFLLAPPDTYEHLVEMLPLLATRSYRLKEPALVSHWFEGRKEDPPTIGWLDLDNPAFFFARKAPFTALCKVFGVSQKVEVGDLDPIF
jgi:hypothetical protein